MSEAEPIAAMWESAREVDQALDRAEESEERLERCLLRVRAFLDLPLLGELRRKHHPPDMDNAWDLGLLLYLLGDLERSHDYGSQRRSLRDFGRDGPGDEARWVRIRRFLTDARVPRPVRGDYRTSWLLPGNVGISGSAVLECREGDVQVLRAVWERVVPVLRYELRSGEHHAGDEEVGAAPTFGGTGGLKKAHLDALLLELNLEPHTDPLTFQPTDLDLLIGRAIRRGLAPAAMAWLAVTIEQPVPPAARGTPRSFRGGRGRAGWACLSAVSQRLPGLTNPSATALAGIGLTYLAFEGASKHADRTLPQLDQLSRIGEVHPRVASLASSLAAALRGAEASRMSAASGAGPVRSLPALLSRDDFTIEFERCLELVPTSPDEKTRLELALNERRMLALDGAELKYRRGRKAWRRIGPNSREGKFIIRLAAASQKPKGHVHSPLQSETLTRAREALATATGGDLEILEENQTCHVNHRMSVAFLPK